MPWVAKMVYKDLIAEVRRLRDLVLIVSGNTTAVSHESNVRRAEEPRVAPPAVTPRRTHSDLEEAFRERMGRYPSDMEAASLQAQEARDPLLGGEE